MAMGVMAYLSSALWLLFLALCTGDILSKALEVHQFFPVGYSLFPVWAGVQDRRSADAVGATLGMLFAPKLLALCLTLMDGGARRQFGGAPALLLGALMEQLMTALLAPVMMLFHSRFVITTLLGGNTSWAPPPRDDRGLGWLEALPTFLGPTLLGLAWGAGILTLAPGFFWWLSPVLLGLVVSWPTAVLISRASLGRRLRALGLLTTPEERAPAPELRNLGPLCCAYAQALSVKPPAGWAVQWNEADFRPPERPTPMPPQTLGRDAARRARARAPGRGPAATGAELAKQVTAASRPSALSLVPQESMPDKGLSNVA